MTLMDAVYPNHRNNALSDNLTMLENVSFEIGVEELKNNLNKINAAFNAFDIIHTTQDSKKIIDSVNSVVGVHKEDVGAEGFFSMMGDIVYGDVPKLVVEGSVAIFKIIRKLVLNSIILLKKLMKGVGKIARLSTRILRSINKIALQLPNRSTPKSATVTVNVDNIARFSILPTLYGQTLTGVDYASSLGKIAFEFNSASMNANQIHNDSSVIYTSLLKHLHVISKEWLNNSGSTLNSPYRVSDEFIKSIGGGDSSGSWVISTSPQLKILNETIDGGYEINSSEISIKSVSNILTPTPNEIAGMSIRGIDEINTSERLLGSIEDIVGDLLKTIDSLNKSRPHAIIVSDEDRNRISKTLNLITSVSSYYSNSTIQRSKDLSGFLGEALKLYNEEIE